jgi:hypothetical protein
LNNQSITNAINAIVSEGEPLWIANYSDFLTKINWAQVMNGTLMTGENFTLQNQSLINYINSVGVGEPNWNANYTAFNESWSYTYNETTNTTLTNAINNIVSEGEPLWNSNYSEFLTHITWNDVMNGTLMTGQNFTLQNESMKNYIDSRGSGTGNGTITGAGITGYVPMWNGTNSLNNSGIYQNGTNIGIGITDLDSLLNIYGSGATVHVISSDTNSATLKLTTSLYNGTFDINQYGTINIEAPNAIQLFATGVDGSVGIIGGKPLVIYNTPSTKGGIIKADDNYLYIQGNSLNSGLAFAGNLTTNMVIQSGGNVGIGTTNPLATLHVNGSAIINGTLNMDSNKIINLSNGTSPTDAVTLAQLQAVNASAASAGEPLWIANYSEFLTHITWNDVMNGTLMTGENFTLQNESIRNYINWINSSMAYIGEANWNANYSQFLLNNQSITNAINSIVSEGEPLWIGNATAFNASWLNTYNETTNTTLTNAINANNASITNSIVANNASITNLITTNNASVTNAINNIVSEGEPLWNANYSEFLTHITWNDVMNGTLMTGENFTLQNQSIMNYINSIGVGEANWNANYSQFLLNNQSITNAINSIVSEGEPLWIANYSDFLTKINWSQVMNGTLMTGENFTLQNESMKNYIDSRGSGTGNGTVTGTGTLNYVPMWNGTNSLNNSAIYQNGSNIGIGTTSPQNKLDIFGNVGVKNGGALLLYTTSNNDAGSVYYDDSYLLKVSSPSGKVRVYGFNGLDFVTYLDNESVKMFISDIGNVGIGTTNPLQKLHVNGSAIINGTLNMDSNKIINLSNGTSPTDAVTLAQLQAVNASAASAGEPLWIANYSAFNASWNNMTNTSYLPLAGGTMTGNLNLSSNVNLTMNGGNQISSNVTCVTIKGATSVLEIC